MGNYGSGRWHGRGRRVTVERCLLVDAGDLPSVTMPSQQLSLPVRRHGGQIAATLTCRSLRLDDGTLALGFQIPMGDEILNQAIPIGSTPARAGGSRICFLCPISNGERFCRNPSRRLFAPPGVECLGCRKCHKLSFSSSQRRRERLTRSDKEADRLADEADAIFSRIERGESVRFDETLRSMRRMSSAVLDLFESLRQSAESQQ